MIQLIFICTAHRHHGQATKVGICELRFMWNCYYALIH